MSGYKDINAAMGVQVWNMKAGEEGEPFRLTKQWAKSVSVHGTFGESAAIMFEGTLDPGDNPRYFPLTEKHGSLLSFSYNGLKSVCEDCYAVRPRVIGGNTSTDLTVILLVETEA